MTADIPRILCQPDPSKSCGACCGFYNQRGVAPRHVMDALRTRTAAYRAEADIADLESLREFRARHEPVGNKLVGGLPSCPFLGMIDARRIGCLVHPAQNGGVDGRDCGVYDRHTCEDYLCAAHSVLRPIEKWLVIAACDDSYTYGLVITDPLFVRQLFELTARRNAAMPSAGRVMQAAAAARPYFALKRDFAYRAADGVLGQVVGSAGLDTPRRLGPSEGLGVEPDEHEAALRCLGAAVASRAELGEARRIVAESVEVFARAVAVG